MTTVVVLHRPQSPSGGSPRTMRAELIASLAAYTDDATTTVLGAEDFEPDSTGLVTMQLRPNSELQQTGTYYRVRIARSDITYYAVVPDAGPVQLVNILVDPTTLNPVGPIAAPLFQLRSEKAQASGYASLDGTGKVPTAQLPAGSGGGIESVNGDTGPAVVLDAADVGAVPVARTISGTAGRIIGGGDLSADRTLDLHADVVSAIGAAATAVQPSLIDAKGDLPVGSAADTLARLAVGSNGQTLVADSSQSTGARWTARPRVGYDLGGYGLVAANDDPIHFTAPSTFSTRAFMVRVPVPAGVALTTCWAALHVAGTIAAGGVNGFAVYDDANGTLIGTTPDDNALWTTAGPRGKNLSVPISARTSDWAVWLEISQQGHSVEPFFAFVTTASGSGLVDSSAWPSGKRRSLVSTGAGHPAGPLDFSSFGSATGGYMPFGAIS